MKQFNMSIIEAFENKSGIKVITDIRLAKVVGFKTKYRGAYIPPPVNLNLVYGINNGKMEFVFIKDNLEDAFTTHVLLHEIAHATGIRLGRNLYKNKDKEEVIAELTAIHLLNHFDVATEEDYRFYKRYMLIHEAGLSVEEYKDCQRQVKLAYDYILTHWLHEILVPMKVAV